MDLRDRHLRDRAGDCLDLKAPSKMTDRLSFAVPFSEMLEGWARTALPERGSLAYSPAGRFVFLTDQACSRVNFRK